MAGRLDDAVWVCGALTDEDAMVAGEHGGAAFRMGDDEVDLVIRMMERTLRRNASSAR